MWIKHFLILLGSVKSVSKKHDKQTNQPTNQPTNKQKFGNEWKLMNRASIEINN